MRRYCNRLSQVLIVVLVTVLASLGQAVALLPQTPLKSSDRLIKLSVLVLDAQSRPIMDVKREEFRVLENGSAQTISYFSTDELPLDYCIVLDTSGSLKKSSDQLIDAVQTIVRNNKPGDETALIEFKDQR